METSKYFTRTINEGAVLRTHILSTDPDVVLTMVRTRAGKVMDSLLIKTSIEKETEKEIIKTVKDETAKMSFISGLNGLRINGKPILYEDLGDNFTYEEIIEIMGFVNDSDMSIFQDDKKIDEKEEPKNV
jgi:hypothetical protein